MSAGHPDGPVRTARRLDWRVLVVHAITFRQARGILSGAGPIALIGGVQGLINTAGLIAIAVAVTVASLVFSALRWWRFSYQIDPERLIVSQGLVARSDRAVPLDRVRGVDLEAPLLHRLFRIVVLRVDAAAGTGGQDEAVLDAVSADEADRLRALLLARGPAVPASPEGQPVLAAPAEHVFARLNPRWLLYAPLVGSYLAVPLAIGGTVFRDVDILPIPRGLRDLFRVPDDANAARVAATVGAVILAVVLGALIAGTVANWGFVLLRRGTNLVAERGLLTRRTVTLEIDRIRGYVVADGPGLRLVRAARLTALVTGLGDESRRGQLLPLGPRTVVDRVAAAAVRRFDVPLRMHPSAALRRRLIRSVLPPLLLAAVLILTGAPVAVVLVAGVLALLGVPLGIDRYRSLGHAADAAALSVRSGSLVRHRAVLERRALVGWKARQSIFQRRAGVVTMTACVGAGQGGYDVLDCGTDQGLRLVAAVSPGWADPVQAR